MSLTLDDLPAGGDPAVLDRFAVVKLNGGLATTMGLRRPESLVEARDGRSFLEIIIGQTLALRHKHGVRLPLVLMDSEATRDETLEALAAHPDIETDGLALDFLQSMVPKLEAESLDPSAGRARRRRNGFRRAMATCTAPCSGRACSTHCWGEGSRTR